MQDKYFRLFENESKVWICLDESIFSPDFPEYLKMIQMREQGRYSLCMRTGVKDLEDNYIYECDIVSYNKKIYRVVMDDIGFLLESTDREFTELIPFDTLTVIGNLHESEE